MSSCKKKHKISVISYQISLNIFMQISQILSIQNLRLLRLNFLKYSTVHVKMFKKQEK